ncbi:heterokaryon incompatibility protein-domain-containing protein [Xylariales sp. AK1849]|nr:heterokaryon incompatibility protein-domain-containing protein [Xylariales sp. AK1849]
MSRLFSYNNLEGGQYRLFKLDVDGPSGSQLSGQLITLHHPRSYALSWKRVAKSYWNWNDMRYLERSGSGYDALSYVWGSADGQQPLLLRTSERVWQGKTLKTNDPGRFQGQISITANLHVLLLELRHRRYDDFVWIDAICINQRDAAEKSMQIPLMRNIYEETKRVLVWLGPVDNVTKGALKILPNLTKIFEGIDPRTYVFDPNNLETFTAKGIPPPDDAIWRAIGCLMAHPWFMRLWTLQEVTLPKKVDVLCGSETLDWDTFSNFARATRTHPNRGWSLRSQSAVGNTTTGWDSCSMIDLCRELRAKNVWGMPLDSLLGVIRRRQVSVPTDIVFGIMGLMAPNAVKQMGPVDVTSSLPRVYLQFAQYYIHEEPAECILHHVASARRDQGLPSWCPDFSRPEETAALGSAWYYDHWLGPEVGDRRFRAGWRRSGPGALPVRKHFILHMMASSLHQRTFTQGIYDPGDPGSENPNTFAALAQTAAWERRCWQLAQRVLGTIDDDVPAQYYRTMVANQIPGLGLAQIWDEPDAFHFADEYRGWRDYLAAVIAAGVALSATDTMDARARHLGVQILRWTKKRSFFATRSGRIGLGPTSTQVGDELCVLWYCPTPYLLRSDPGVSEKFLVGESYVHGLMYGQAIDMLERGELTEQEWIIK